MGSRLKCVTTSAFEVTQGDANTQKIRCVTTTPSLKGGRGVVMRSEPIVRGVTRGNLADGQPHGATGAAARNRRNPRGLPQPPPVPKAPRGGPKPPTRLLISNDQETSMKTNQYDASRLGELEHFAAAHRAAALEANTRVRNLTEQLNADRRRLEKLEAERYGWRSEDERRRLAARIEARGTDIASATARRDRASAAHQQARATYNAARDRARELNLAIPATGEGDEFPIAATEFGNPETSEKGSEK